MKSILIIETPEDCLACPCFSVIGSEHCSVTMKEVGLHIPKWCPLRTLPKWKIDGCSAFNERGGIVYDDEVFDWVKELIE